MRLIKLFAFAAALTLLLPAAALPQTRPPSTQTATAPERLLSLLEKTGYGYSKAGEGIWVVTLEGKNLKEIGIIVQSVEDLVLLQTQVAERKAVADKPALLLKLLELNHEYDAVKFAVSPEMLYARTEAHARLLDPDQLKYLINQLALLADEASPQLRPLLNTR